jgi:hypothetical protein
VDFAFVNETHERQTLVHLSQVQHDVFSRVLVRKPDERAALLVEFAATPFLVDAIDASHVDQHVDQLRTYFVVLHVHWRGVSGDVDFRNDVEKECLLDVGPGHEGVHHRGNEGHLGQQLLDDLAEGLVDGVVIDAGEVVGHLAIALVVLEQALHVGLDLVETVRLLVVIHEHVRVHLVNEHFIVQVRLDARRQLNQFLQLYARGLVLLLLRVDYVDERAALRDLALEIVLKLVVAWEVYQIEIDVFVGVDLLRLDLGRRQQEEGLVRRKLLEHHFLNGRLPGPK